MKFHLPSVPAYIWVQQLCAMYARWENKTGFSSILESSLKFKKFVTNRSFDIKIQLKSKKLGDIIFYKSSFNIDDGKIVGSGKFIFSPKDILPPPSANP